MAVQAHPCQPSDFQAFHQPAGSLPELVELLVELVPPAAVELPPLLDEELLLLEVPPAPVELEPPLFVEELLLLLEVPPAPVELEPPLDVLLDEELEVPPWLELPPLAVEELVELDEELVLLPPWLAAVVVLELPPWLEDVLELELELELELLPPLALLLAAEQTPALHWGLSPLQTTPHWPQLLLLTVTSVHCSWPLIMHAC
jgi:hypothetical protein